MPRIRSVHPDICVSPTMAEIPANLERTFVRLWTHCDDEGRCLDNPRLIKAAIYPLNDEQTWQVVDGELEALDEAGLIVRYQAEGSEVIQVTSWDQYQHPQKPKESGFPPPPEASVLTLVPVPAVADASTRQLPERYAVGEGEGEGEGVGEGDIAPAALDDLKDSLVEIFGEPPPQNWSLYNRIATWIRDRGGTPDDVRLKAGLIAEEWGRKALTPTSLEKHWTRYDAKVGQLSDADVKRYQAEVQRARRRKEIIDGP